MGIRIHKMCGWGLTDLVKDDPRVDWGGRYFDYRHDDFDADGYLEVARKTEGTFAGLDSMMIKDRRKKGKRELNPADCAVFGSVDAGLENVMCVRPFAMPEWHRFDDTIDWLEEGGEPNSKVRVLDHGIFPYDGFYMDSRTGGGVLKGTEVRRWMRIVEKAGEESFDAQVQGEIAGVFETVNKMTYEYAKEFLVPAVPGDVRALVEYLGIFADPEAWKGLRPMVYTYWG